MKMNLFSLYQSVKPLGKLLIVIVLIYTSIEYLY